MVIRQLQKEPVFPCFWRAETVVYVAGGSETHLRYQLVRPQHLMPHVGWSSCIDMAMAWAWQASGTGQPGLPLWDRGCSGCHGPPLEVPAAGGAVPARLEICRGSLTDCTVLGDRGSERVSTRDPAARCLHAICRERGQMEAAWLRCSHGEGWRLVPAARQWLCLPLQTCTYSAEKIWCSGGSAEALLALRQLPLLFFHVGTSNIARGGLECVKNKNISPANFQKIPKRPSGVPQTSLQSLGKSLDESLQSFRSLEGCDRECIVTKCKSCLTNVIVIKSLDLQMRKGQYTSLTSALAKLSPVSPQCSCVQARPLQSEWMDNCMSKILTGWVQAEVMDQERLYKIQQKQMQSLSVYLG